MGHQTHPESMAAETSQHHVVNPSDGAAATSVATADLPWPFAKLDGIDLDDLRDTAYEIFFTACRSAPGFGGRHALSYYPSEGGGGEGGGSPKKVASVAPSRIKRALGLKILRRSQSRRTSSMGSSPFSPPAYHSHHHHTASSPGLAFSTVPQYRSRRPMTSAEIMRQQMNVTEQSDHRLRKTLMRTLVGQLGRRPETIILPLELLRHLKPSEFNDANEYHLWQMRQLKILEAGLVLFPSIHLDKSNQFAMRLKEIVRSSEIKPIDTGKNSEIMKTLYNCVVSLAWRTPDGFPTNTCRWADGFPVNVNIYAVLLRAIFDLKDETMVLDEVDELLDLMKKTWSMLGINKGIHNLCFTWVLFHQYVVTGQVEADLLSAALAMLNEVAADAKRGDYGEPLYVKMLSSVLNSMKKWSEKRLLNYHGTFYRGTVGLMENLLPLVFSVTNILEEDVENKGAVDGAKDSPAASCRVDHYIRSSLQFAFTRLLENGNVNGTTFEVQEVTEALLQIAKETEELALKEKIIFSPVLKKWHPVAAGVAAVTLHNCYGTLLKQYLGGVSVLTNETVMVLQRAGKLEKSMVQMVVEDSVDCEDGGKSVVREMVPYEVDTFIVNLLKQWIQERLNIGKQRLQTAKETETWNPKSKTEPYAQSSVELMKHAKETVDAFLEIPLGISEELVHDLADGLENLFRDYTTFVASCGCKQSYMPTLPPLTRCNRDSTFLKLWKRASPCAVTVDDTTLSGLNEGNHPRPSTSRGTQRLYIRLNTLHYLLSQIHSLDKVLSTSPRIIPLSHSRFNKPGHIGSSSYFEMARSGIQEATQHVSEVAAYRLIFLDSNSVFYDTLYVADVKNARIKPALRILKQNLTLLGAMVTDRAQPLAIKEVMKASFEAFLMVLLAGGTSRTFSVMDHEMIADDFDNLKRVFCTCGEGLISEDTVDREAEMVEGVVALMGQSTGQLVEDFSIVACEASGIGIVGAGQKLPMPPTTGRWNRFDPNTLLRVLCHRNDRSANEFLKRTFQLAKRR